MGRMIDYDEGYDELEEAKAFKKIGEESIHNALSCIGFEYNEMNVDEFEDRGCKPDLIITPYNKMILEWWFVFKHPIDAHTREDGSVDVKWLLGNFMFLRNRHDRKISIVVGDERAFYSAVDYKDHLSYRGELSVILLDRNTLAPVKEVYLSHYREIEEDYERTVFTIV